MSKSKTDPLKPNPQLLVKLGSLIVHYEEASSPGGHVFDVRVIDDLRSQPDVAEWFEAMRKLALLPVKR